ncbi:MAG: urea ABC transporter ATP-binding protein UrtD [Polyangiaceae bacterium]
MSIAALKRTVLSDAGAKPTSAPPKRTSRRPHRLTEADAARIRANHAKALLCVDDVTVSFDGFHALTNLTLVFDEGELRSIIGPNGAGKTTLMDVITGKTRPDSGTVFFVGDLENLTTLREHEIVERGVGRKFQRPTVFPEHTLWENIGIALRPTKSALACLFARETAEQRDRIAETLETVGLLPHHEVRAGTLSHGQKQWLEIGMLLAQRPRVLLVDEPVAGMTQSEIEKTVALLRNLRGKHTVIVVEHDMEFVRNLECDRVTVMHEGKLLAEGSLEEVQRDRRVVEVYLGE